MLEHPFDQIGCTAADHELKLVEVFTYRQSYSFQGLEWAEDEVPNRRRQIMHGLLGFKYLVLYNWAEH